MVRVIRWLVVFLIFFFPFYACLQLKKAESLSRIINILDIGIPVEYVIEPVVNNLNFPIGIAFDANNDIFILEAGNPTDNLQPRLLKYTVDGLEEIASGGVDSYWSGIEYFDGYFYVVEGGGTSGGKIFKISPEGVMVPMVENLPSSGDHGTYGPAIKDGYIYFGQGTATNSGVVGPDNSWLIKKIDFHDIPCHDLVLKGENYVSMNVFSGDDPKDKVETAAYRPFGVPSEKGETIPAKLPCSGAIMRTPLVGGDVELVASGLRSPTGLAFAPDGKLYVTEKGFEDRGSRPVWNSQDVLWEIRDGLWYGWPDFSAGKSIVDDEELKSPKRQGVKAILSEYPNQPPNPVALLGNKSGPHGFDFSKNMDFGFAGQAFIALAGDLTADGKGELLPTGYKIVMVDIEKGSVLDFITNKGGKRKGPASLDGLGGLERPIAVKFDRNGEAMYIADFGIVKNKKPGLEPVRQTGVIWKVGRKP